MQEGSRRAEAGEGPMRGDSFSLRSTLDSYEVEEIDSCHLGRWLLRHAPERYEYLPSPEVKSVPRHVWSDDLSLRATAGSYEVEEIDGNYLGSWAFLNPTKLLDAAA
jgi:hypothetical protein